MKKDSADLAQEELIQSAKVSELISICLLFKLVENANSNLPHAIYSAGGFGQNKIGFECRSRFIHC